VTASCSQYFKLLKELVADFLRACNKTLTGTNRLRSSPDQCESHMSSAYP